MLGQRLESLIKTIGIKKGDFAEKVGFSQAYISMIIGNAQRVPSDRFFESVKREFNVNIDWLKNGTGDMFIVDDPDFTPLEKELITKYNLLPLSERKVIDDIVDALLLKTTKPKEKE